MDSKAPRDLRKRPLLPPAFVRAMLAGHSALGLAFAALIYGVCLSGTLCVFQHELQRWEQPDAPVVSHTLGPEAVAAAVREGYKQALADHATSLDLYIAGPQGASPRFEVHYDDHKAGIEGEWLADETGRLVTRIAAPWAEFIGELHMQLHLPRQWGLYLVGLTGVALLSSLISGLLSHPRIFKDAFALRWGGSRRLQNADLHNRLGVWGLPFHVVVTVTGALLGLSTLIVNVLALAAYDGDAQKALSELFGPRPGANQDQAPVPDVGAMIRYVKSSAPDAEFASVYMQHVGTAGQIVQLGMRNPGQIASATTYYFDAAGQPIARPAEATVGIGRWILGALQPLHFGWFDGLPVKLLYGVLGLALTIVTHTGVVIWLERRRDRGRPAPRWEKAWSGLVWGQPLAFATTAIVALAFNGAVLLQTYLATLVLAVGVAGIAKDGREAANALRVALGLALLGAAATHAVIWRVHATDAMALYIDLAIVACAATASLPLIVSMRTATRSRGT